MKKIVNSIFSVALAGLMVMPALADNTKSTTITIGNDISDSYDAYQLLTVDTALKDSDAAEGHTHTDACYEFVYSVNSAYKSYLIEGTKADGLSQTALSDDATDAQVLNYIQKVGEDVQKYANAVYMAIKQAGASVTPDYNDVDSPMTVKQGYYLIAGSGTVVMLDTAGEVAVTTTAKPGDYPTVEKTVEEKNDSTGTSGTYGTTADYDAGDTIAFKLTGKMPENIGAYARYRYVFHDTLDDTLTLDSSSIVVKIGNTTVDKSMYSVVTKEDDGSLDCSFEVRFKNIKNVGISITKDSVVTVEYNATLAKKVDDDDTTKDPNAKQENSVTLEYSTDPYFTGYGDGYDEPGDEPGPGEDPDPDDPDEPGPRDPTEESTPAEVSVFTYTVTVNKVDQVGEAKTGATFALYKYNVSSTKEDKYDLVKEIVGTDISKFKFTGLDAGDYKLVETKAPDGYVKADDIKFTITATTTQASTSDASTATITSLSVVDSDGEEIVDVNGTPTFTAQQDSKNALTGELTTNVENVYGTELPSTGGAGTYMLYGLGCALCVGGAALAITKKRRMA